MCVRVCQARACVGDRPASSGNAPWPLSSPLSFALPRPRHCSDRCNTFNAGHQARGGAVQTGPAMLLVLQHAPLSNIVRAFMHTHWPLCLHHRHHIVPSQPCYRGRTLDLKEQAVLQCTDPSLQQHVYFAHRRHSTVTPHVLKSTNSTNPCANAHKTHPAAHHHTRQPLLILILANPGCKTPDSGIPIPWRPVAPLRWLPMSNAHAAHGRPEPSCLPKPDP